MTQKIVIIEAEDSYSFEIRVQSYMSDGYLISSTSMIMTSDFHGGGRTLISAVLIKDVT